MSGKDSQQTVLGPDCRIKGEMTLEGDGTIHGQFEGTLRAGGVLELGESSQISGTVIAGAARLGGHADADIIAEHGVELLAGTQLSGRLFTNRLSIVDGASFAGEVVVGPKAMDAAQEVMRDVEAHHHGNGRRAPGRVETVSNSLDNILQQHRSRTAQKAETTSNNGD
jgi:cytoskeletal protein CcmA (bactofilin family)